VLGFRRSSIIPGSKDPVRPFFLKRDLHLPRHARWHRAQRTAIEINGICGQIKIGSAAPCLRCIHGKALVLNDQDALPIQQ
jgi:hypothetical protein